MHFLLRQIEWPALRLTPTILILLVAVWNIVQAALVLNTRQAARTTALIAFGYITPGGPTFAAWILIAIAVLAIIGSMFRVGRIRLAILLPQNLSLAIMAFGGVMAAINGTYLDGTRTPWQHILADQLIVFVVFIAHSYAILRRAGVVVEGDVGYW